MPLIRTPAWRIPLLLAGLWLIVFSATRLTLLLSHWQAAEPSLGALVRLFGVGFLYDLGFLAYALLPLSLACAVLPNKVWSSKLASPLLHILFTLSLFLMLFVALAEWLFWDEFGVRFNFIAVDYLVYSDEVIRNILESYPVWKLLGAIASISILACLALHGVLQKSLASLQPTPISQRLASPAAVGALALLGALILTQQQPLGLGGNTYQRELTGNGPYQFFAAFRNNELDYNQFYSTLPKAEVAQLLRNELSEPRAHFVAEDPLDIRRVIDNPGAEQRMNVVLVTIESLSAKYLGSYGDTRGLTPNLDELRKHSLTFSNFYATGTRTDRGLEAITLAIPPTPGRSIVKRIGRESGYASLGQQFAAKGYDSVFMYGGRGYFDNMNAFFSGNGYRIVDQSSVIEQEIHFKNAWGMADEDLYNQALKTADSDFAKKQPFYLQLMTTSNHRPYTFPAGRIDLPSGDGREGAVKYTDWAIGDFLAKAKEKPWFDNTLFIFVADHCAGSAGKEDLPVANYQIPLFIYAPKFIEPRDDTQLASQIDLAPTLLGLLNFSYTSTFFGRDLLVPEHLPPRVLLGNYQHLGLFDGKNLAILSPRQGQRRHDDALGKSIERKVDSTDPLLARDIAYYQGASYAFKHGLLAWQQEPAAKQGISAR